MEPPETLKTHRLVLERSRVGDAAEVFQTYTQDAEVCRFMTWRPHRTISDTVAYLKSRDQAWKDGIDYHWLIRRRRDRALLGSIGLRPAGFKADIGYLIARPFWNRGYMTEAVRALVRWSLAQRGIYRVWAYCDLENLASARVMEKAGMRREGILRRWMVHPNLSDQPQDCYCYAKTK